MAASCTALLGCAETDPVDRAAVLFDEGEVDAALEVLGGAVAADPSDARLQHHYGAALVKSSRLSRAIWPLRRAAADPAYAVRSGTLLAQTQFMASDNGDAVRSAERVLELDPDNFVAGSTRARALLKLNDFELALEAFDVLLEQRPGEIEVMQGRLEALLRLGRAAEAAELIEDLKVASGEQLVPDPQLAARLCAMEATFVAERGEDEQAIELFDACLAEYPDSPLARRFAIDFYDARGEPESANQVLVEMIDRNPTSVGVRQELASRLRLAGRSDEARVLLQQGAEQAGTMRAWGMLVDHEVAVGDLAAAKEAIEQIFAIQTGATTRPGEPGFAYEKISEEKLYAYGDIVVQLGERDIVEQVHAHLEYEPLRHFLMGRVHFEDRQWEAALAEFEQGFVAWPGNQGIRYLAARASEQLGDFDQAAAHYRNSIRGGPEKTPAGLELGRLNLALGNSVAAVINLQHHVKAHPEDIEGLRLYSHVASLVGSEEGVQAARSALAVLPGGEDIATADHARDLAAVDGAEKGIAFLEERRPDMTAPEARETLRAWAMLVVSRGGAPRALERLEEALAQRPDDAALYLLRAEVRMGLGGVEAARRDVEKALELEPDVAEGLLMMARLHIAEGRVEQAVDYYDRAAAASDEMELRSASMFEAAGAVLAEAQESGGSTGPGEERLRVVLFEYPTHGLAAVRLARLAFERDEFDDAALRMAERGSRLSGDGDAYDVLGGILLARGESEAAVAVLREAIVRGASGGETHYRLGLAHAARGDVSEAREALRAAVEKGGFPYLDAARVELSRLDAKVGGTADEAA